MSTCTQTLCFNQSATSPITNMSCMLFFPIYSSFLKGLAAVLAPLWEASPCLSWNPMGKVYHQHLFIPNVFRLNWRNHSYRPYPCFLRLPRIHGFDWRITSLPSWTECCFRLHDPPSPWTDLFPPLLGVSVRRLTKSWGSVKNIPKSRLCIHVQMLQCHPMYL